MDSHFDFPNFFDGVYTNFFGRKNLRHFEKFRDVYDVRGDARFCRDVFDFGNGESRENSQALFSIREHFQNEKFNSTFAAPDFFDVLHRHRRVSSDCAFVRARHERKKSRS